MCTRSYRWWNFWSWNYFPQKMNYQECWITGAILCIKAQCAQECCHGKETNWITAKFLSLIFALLLLYAVKL